MSRPRFIFLVLLALASGGLALFVVVDAVIHEALSRSVLYAVLPLGGDLLLTLQSQPHPDLQLPGGGIDGFP